MWQRAWVKEIGKQLREDMGDCPTLPEEMRNLLRQLDELKTASPDEGHNRQVAWKPVKGIRDGRRES
jgi:hypothetical protein